MMMMKEININDEDNDDDNDTNHDDNDDNDNNNNDGGDQRDKRSHEGSYAGTEPGDETPDMVSFLRDDSPGSMPDIPCGQPDRTPTRDAVSSEDTPSRDQTIGTRAFPPLPELSMPDVSCWCRSLA